MEYKKGKKEEEREAGETKEERRTGNDKKKIQKIEMLQLKMQ